MDVDVSTQCNLELKHQQYKQPKLSRTKVRGHIMHAL